MGILNAFMSTNIHQKIPLYFALPYNCILRPQCSHEDLLFLFDSSCSGRYAISPQILDRILAATNATLKHLAVTDEGAVILSSDEGERVINASHLSHIAHNPVCYTMSAVSVRTLRQLESLHLTIGAAKCTAAFYVLRMCVGADANLRSLSVDATRRNMNEGLGRCRCSAVPTDYTNIPRIWVSPRVYDCHWFLRPHLYTSLKVTHVK